jgi:hypothetical protein
MAVQLSEEQFQQLMIRVGGQSQARIPRHFTQCSARFNGTRSAAAVEEFVTAATIYKKVEGISDEDALEGLPLLLTGEANPWWNGIKSNVSTWKEAMDLVKNAFAPRVPNYRLFQDIFETQQSAAISTDQYVTMQRDRLARMFRKLDEEWQLDVVYGLLRKAICDRVPRDAVANFAELLEKARVVEQSERESRKTVQEAAAPEKRGGKSQGNRSIKCEYCRNFGREEHECQKKQRDVAQGQTASTSRSAPRPSKTAAEKKQIHCYGCHRPGVYRDNCPTCSGPNSGVSNEICALTVHPVVPRLSPTVLVSIADLQESAIIDTAACNSVASAGLYKHLLATGHPTQKVLVAITFADGNTKTLLVPTVRAIVKLADHEIRTTFVVLSKSDSTRTLLGADFIEDSKLVLDLSSRKYGFNYAPGSWYPFLPSTTPGPGMDTIDAIFQEMKMPSLIEPLADNDARDYQSPTSGITQPAIHDGRGVWNVYQARGSSDYIMQDAADALMDYEMESSSGNDSPIRIHLATLHLRPVEGASLPEIEQERLNALLDQHVELFAKTGPPTPFAEHQIDTGDSTPIASPPYRLTPGKRQILQVEINAMLEAGIIEECESAWASPAVLVPKPDGSIPVCVDYRRLNAVTKPDMYPLPRMDDLLNAIGPIGCISTLDLQAGYWQIQIRSEDRDKTALVCPFGLYRFLRMPFGLRNAPASFQRLIDRFKTGLPDVILLA